MVNRAARYSNIAFQHNSEIENAIYTILNALPMSENVRGGGKRTYKKAFTVNQIIVGSNEYAKSKNALSRRISFLKILPIT